MLPCSGGLAAATGVGVAMGEDYNSGGQEDSVVEINVGYRPHFPNHGDAPHALLALDGNCGPLSVWFLLKHFRKRTSAEKLIRLCRHTKRYGTFTIGLAYALHKHGLRVEFHTENDPAPKPLERVLYPTAKRAGVTMGGPLDMDNLLCRVRQGGIGIVSYDEGDGTGGDGTGGDGTGHFSPVIGMRRNRLILPYSTEGSMKPDEFEKRWRAPGICRQCLFAQH